MLGNGRLEAMCFDNVKRLCHIRGKLRKKVWINTADIILIGLRDFQDEKADVILKYTPDEARQLKSRGQIPENVNIMDTSQFGQDTGGDDIYFDEQLSDEDGAGSDSGAGDGAAGSNQPQTGNLNRRPNNVTKNILEDMTDSEDEDDEDDE
jgi:initiation factor 1A